MHKNTPTQQSVCDKLEWVKSDIFSLLHSEMNCRKNLEIQRSSDTLVGLRQRVNLSRKYGRGMEGKEKGGEIEV